MTAARCPFVRVADFLSPDEAERLFRSLIEQRCEFRARGCDAAGRPTFYRMIRPLAPRPEFAKSFDEIRPLLQRRFDIDLRDSQLELLAQAYNDGGSFPKHNDAHAGGPNWQRRLSGVYYLHARPRQFEGGGLALYVKRRCTVLEPQHNSVVFFPRDLPHEVLPVVCASGRFEDSRFALNVWIG
jgi:hypothetical protein